LETEAKIEKVLCFYSRYGNETGLKIKYSYEIDGKKYIGGNSIVKDYKRTINYNDLKNVGTILIILVYKYNYKKTIINDVFISSNEAFYT
jgi:hypothetical protein